MNSIECIEKLKAISPTKEQILSSGISGIQADLIFSSFNIENKQRFIDNKGTLIWNGKELTRSE